MSVTDNSQPTIGARPRLWWRLVITGTVLYVLLLARNYFLPWPNGSMLIWTAAEILLVAFAVFAAAKDLSAARPSRPLRRVECIALMAAVLLVLLWLAGLVLTWTTSDGRDNVLYVLIGLMVAIPVLPLATLALPGTIVFRRARRA